MWHASLRLYSQLLDASGRQRIVPLTDWSLEHVAAADTAFATIFAGVGDHSVPPIDENVTGLALHRRIPLTSQEEATLPEHPDRAWAREQAILEGFLDSERMPA